MATPANKLLQKESQGIGSLSVERQAEIVEEVTYAQYLRALDMEKEQSDLTKLDVV